MPRDSRDAYEALWVRVRDAVTGAGGHAWRFRSPARSELYLEFIESRELDAVLATEAVASALRALDGEFGPATPEEWEEVTAS